MTPKEYVGIVVVDHLNTQRCERTPYLEREIFEKTNLLNRMKRMLEERRESTIFVGERGE